jgi:isopenicillin-N epimerase
MERRGFLVRTGLALGASAFSPQALSRAQAAVDDLPDLSSWDAVRAQFDALDPKIVHMASFFLASHPRPVSEAIERHRRALDANPIGCIFGNEERLEGETLAAAATYLGVQPTEIALTDSTTEGLGLLYGGLRLAPGQEILTTTHDHYSTETALQLRAERTGANVRRVALYAKPSAVSVDEVVGNLTKAIGAQTRYVAATWVHSSTGVKLPIRAMADALASVNARRDAKERVTFCVDGLHGLGVEDVKLPDLGCDFFIAGCHKWLFGPRGTGLVWGRPDAWTNAQATIPTFSFEAYEMWMGVRPQRELPVSVHMSPGGFHAFEHRWALPVAFAFHERIGKPRVEGRIHALNTQLKDGLGAMKNVTLYTPRDPALSAGIVCFDVAGMSAEDVAKRLFSRGIAASVTPYKTQYARLAPSLVTSAADVDRTLAEVRALAG